MVEIRVAVPFDGARNELRLRSEWEWRGVVQVIDTVERDA